MIYLNEYEYNQRKQELKQWCVDNADQIFPDFKKQGSRFVSAYHLNGTKGSGGVQCSVNGSTFKDWGTDEQVDVIELYMRRNNCDFTTAVEELCRIANIDVFCRKTCSITQVRHKSNQTSIPVRKTPQTARKPYNFHKIELVKAMQKNFEKNNLALYLENRFGKEVAKRMLYRYNIGTAKIWDGATVFPYIDESNNVCSIKIMLYENVEKFGIISPHRKKSERSIDWVHSIMEREKKIPDFNKKPCLFGEHLLGADTRKKVAIVESEKTAVIASEYLPEFIWVSCGGLANLTEEICKSLKFRDVVLFPDGGEVKQKKDGVETMVCCYSLWEEKAMAIRHLFRSCSISPLIEKRTLCTEEDWQNGIDLCDILLRHPLPPIQEKQLSPKERILRELIKQNPLLQNLIEKFNLM